MYDRPTKPERQNTLESTYQNYLQERLNQHAENHTLSLLELSLNRLSTYQPRVIPEVADGTVRDTGFDIRALYELRESGLLEAINSVPLNERTNITTTLGNLYIDRYGQRKVGLAFGSKTGEHSRFTEDNLSEARSTLHELVVNSPLASIFQERSQDVVIGSQTEFSNDTICFGENPSLSTVVLGLLNPYSTLRINTNLIDPGVNLDQIAADYLSELLNHNAVLNNDGIITETKIPLHDGVEVILEPTEPTTAEEIMKVRWKMAIRTDPSTYLLEVADQSERSTCEIFFNRPTGKAFVGALQSSGICFSSSFEDFISTGKSPDFDKRYGGAYTQMSRTLAKIIFTGDLNKLNDIFMNPNGAGITNEQIAGLLSFQSEDEGFKAFQHVLQQIVRHPVVDDPQATSAWVSINEGSCFDVMSYYLQARQYNDLQPLEINGNRFLHKTHGKPTMINTTPIKYKGITLPKGSLFIEANDGGLAFLRFTPFMFENREDMVSAFGTKVIKAETNEVDPMDLTETINALQI